MPKKNLTTKKDFALFKRKCKQWLKIFGLMGWDVQFEHGGTDDDSLAECSAMHEGRLVLLGLASDWGTDERTPQRMARVAFHEVDELRFAPLADIVADLQTGKMVAQKRIDGAFHELIRQDENIFFDGCQDD